MSTSLTTAARLEPGEVVVLDLGSRSEEWVRVTATSGVGPFTSEVRALGRWERRWLIVRGAVLRLWRRWKCQAW